MTNHSSYKISIKGLNLHHLISYFENEGIFLQEVERLSQKKLTCIISYRDYIKLKKSKISKTYKIRIISRYGLENLSRKIVSKLGLITGLIIAILTIFSVTNNIHSLHINTANHICHNENSCIFAESNLIKLKSELNNLGIYENAPISSLPTAKQVKQDLMLKFNQIADVSFTRRGVHLYIDILEAKLPNTKVSENLLSPVNGIIVSINCSSGKQLVNPGDIILTGETLVEKTTSPVAAEVVIRTFYHETSIYNEEQITYTRTEKKKCVNNLDILGLNFNSQPKIGFDLYETETHYNYAFLNFFLPIKIHETIYYELKKTNSSIPFESVKDSLYNELERKTRLLVPKNAEEKKTTFSLHQDNNRYRIDCYIEAYLTIKHNKTA